METKTKWEIDPVHSEIAFKVKYLMISNVRGAFKEFSGTIYSKGDNFRSAEIHLSINPASIDTGNAERDRHLKGADFFDSEKYNQINFRGDTFDQQDKNGKYELTGDLSIKEVTNRVKLNVEFAGINKDPWGIEKAGFILRGKINRTDWDLKWNKALETGGVLVGDEVRIRCEVVLIRSKAESPQ